MKRRVLPQIYSLTHNTIFAMVLRESARIRAKAEQKASVKLQNSRLGRFHAFQGYNYIFACSVLAYLALGGGGTRSLNSPLRYLEGVYETYVTPADFTGRMERMLLAMYWLSPFTVGITYIVGRNDVSTVYATFLTMLLALVMQIRIFFSPIAFILSIVTPVDLGGLVYKTMLLLDDKKGTLISMKERKFLWNVRALPERNTFQKWQEVQCYVFASTFIASSYMSPRYSFPEFIPTSGYASSLWQMWLFVQGVTWVGTIAGVRKGRKNALLGACVNRVIVCYFMTAGISEGIFPNAFGVSFVWPYAVTLVLDLSIYLLY
jgi:hypothetical protein